VVGWAKQSVPINSTKQDSDGASKTGDKLIFAKKTAKKNLSPQNRVISSIPLPEFLVFDRSSTGRHEPISLYKKKSANRKEEHLSFLLADYHNLTNSGLLLNF